MSEPICLAKDRRWPVAVSMTIAVLAVLAVSLTAALAIRGRIADDDHIDALRARIVATETERDEALAEVECLRLAISAAVELPPANDPDRATVELIIQLAEMVDLLLRGEPIPHDPLRTHIITVRTALDDAARATTLLITACPQED